MTQGREAPDAQVPDAEAPNVQPQGSPAEPCEARLDVLHVDMDCFFAAVEALDDPTLRGRPVLVGGTGPRGVVASCSYEARVSGVHSAMAMSEARRRCPDAVVVGGRHDRYGEVSRELHAVFHEFTPVIEPIALDEAFLDVSGSHLLFGASERIARLVRERVRAQLSLECSVGVARSKLVAKLASRDAKPRVTANGPVPGPGVVVVAAEEEAAFLHPRPVRDLWGVGPRTGERLARYGIHTIGDVAALDRPTLVRLVGRAVGSQLHSLASGSDFRRVEADRAVKSIGHEETFPRDLYDDETLHREIVRLSDSVGSRLRAADMVGRTVTLKVRYGDFRTLTRSHSLATPVAAGSEIAALAAALLEGVDISPGVRLIGVSMSSLERAGSSAGTQLSLLEAGLDGSIRPTGDAAAGGGAGTGRAEGSLVTEPPGPHPARTATPTRRRRSLEARDEVERAVDAIRRRYGTRAVGPATLVTGGGVAVKELGDAQWGPSAPEPER